MGKYKKGILGAFSGKIGTVVGSSWNGIEYMRSLPKPSTKAPTDQQLIHRAKFGMVTGFLKPIGNLVNLGYKSQASGMTGYNVATADMMASAIMGIYPNLEIDYTKVLFSKGNLTGVFSVAPTSPNPAELKVTWADNSGSGIGLAADKVVVLMYNPAKSAFVYNLNNGAERSVGEETISLPAEFSGDTVQVWIALMTADKKTFSTSIHAGQIVVA